MMMRPLRRTRFKALAVSVVMALGLGACAAPLLQTPLTPPSHFAGPQVVEQGLGRGQFIVQDGAQLPFLRWSPRDQEPWAVIIALHGFNDHKASFRLAGPWWAERGIETWAYDQRGFGEAPNKGVFAPEALTSQDLNTIVALVKAQRPNAIIAVAGESMGGASAISAFGSDEVPQADRVILLAPAVWGWSSQALPNRVGLWTAARLLGQKAVTPPEFAIRNIRASDNMAELIRMGRDPQTVISTRFDALHGLVELMETASLRLEKIRTPTLLLYGAHDQVIQKAPMKLALERADGNPALRTVWYEDGWHLLNRDLGAQTVFADVEAWLRNAHGDLPSGSSEVLTHLNQE